MSGDLISVRMLIVSSSPEAREHLRLGATMAPTPIEVVEADGAAAACDALARGIDVMLIDGALTAKSRAAIAAAARSCGAPPFVILLAHGHDEAMAMAAETCGDGVAVLSGASEKEVAALIDRCARVRVPSRVLVVDDSSTMRSIVRKILAGSRFRMQITEANEGIAALKQIMSGNVDVAILDYNMPGLNGLETLSEIKRVSPHVSVVLMTSQPDQAIAERARVAGAAAFLRKPFYASDIDAVLCGVFGLRMPGRP